MPHLWGPDCGQDWSSWRVPRLWGLPDNQENQLVPIVGVAFVSR